MKRLITLLLFLYIVLFLFYFGQKEEKAGATYSVSKITLDGIRIQDSLRFHYNNQNIGSVKWCTRMHDSCTYGYSESRYFNSSNELDSINGRWNVTYLYENGLRKKVIAYLDGQFYSATTFMEYAGTNPVKIKIASATSSLNYLDLTFNSSGDLIHKIMKDNEGTIVEDAEIQYSDLENPIQKLIETTSFAVSYFGYDHFAFYYSKHVPKKITITRTNTIFPYHEVIDYTYQKDASGKLILAKAFRNKNNIHNLNIAYQ